MVVFLLALPFTGLAPLWHQKSATSILLICAASLVVLINAAYQGGDREQPVSALMRVAGWAAALTLLPLVGLAAYALYLRIAPYGFTPDRVVATACILVAGAYAVGYALSLGHPKVWLGALERTNLAVSILIIAVLIALFTPIADPARISVADQMSRLAKGKIAADKFDYNFLRFEGARYGRDALKALAAKTDGPDAALIAEKAKAALAREYAYEPPKARSAQEIAASITVYPAGQVLPASFLGQDWATHSGYGLECLRGTEKCDGFFADFTGDGKPEIILIALGSHRAVVFENVADGSWPVLGSLENAYCAGTLEALRSGAFKLVTPRAKEIEIGGRRLHLNGGYEGCPDKTLSSPAQQSSAHDAR
jgi:hypothetical protein